jgi:SpoIIAA-like
MIEFELLKGKSLLILRPRGPLTSDDFSRIAQTVDPYLLDKGRLTGVLIEAPAFPGWESFGAFIEHLKFVRNHHQKIERIAIVTDSEILKLAPRLAEHFAHPAFKVFRSGDSDGALVWLKAGA